MAKIKGNPEIGQKFHRDFNHVVYVYVCLGKGDGIFVFGTINECNEKVVSYTQLLNHRHCRGFNVNFIKKEDFKVLNVQRINSYSFYGAENKKFELVGVKNNKLNRLIYNQPDLGEENEYLYY